MSAKKSFAGTPYSRPPSTPRQQIVRQDAHNGSILKTLFTPSKWFSKKPSTKSETSSDEDDGEEDVENQNDQSGESEISEEDEEENIGIKSFQSPPRARTSSEKDKYSSVELQTPNTSRSVIETNPSSPNSVLAKFFQDKGDTPLTSIELEGVKALLAKQPAHEQDFRDDSQIPSYATPMRRPYRPIFTPAKLLAPTQAATEVKRVRRGYTPSTTAASPFSKRNPARTGFYQARTPHPAQFSTPTKYELRTTIAGNSDDDVSRGTTKRPLEEIAAPLAKRSRQDSQGATDRPEELNPASSTGTKTAASILEILQTDTKLDEPSDHKPPENIKSMLNPYASSSSARKPSSSPRRTPARKHARSAIEEIERSDMLERKIPYQPKKSSGLTNSFSADDDASLFSPRRRIASPAIGRKEFSSDMPRSIQQSLHPADDSTPTKTATNSQDSSSTRNMFTSDSTFKTFSTTPKFSFGASQVSSKASFATEADVGDVTNKSPDSEGERPATTDGVSSQTITSTSASEEPRTVSHNAFAMFSEKSSTEHQKFGGFAVKEQVMSTDPKVDQGQQQTADSNKAQQALKDIDTTIDSGEKKNNDDDVVVHQLRDGTEYVSPSKSSAKVVDIATEKPPANGGFVFKPTHSKFTPSFSFKNSEGSNEPTTIQGGFVFDPTKTVAPTPPSIAKANLVEQSKVSKNAEDGKERALAVPSDKLHQVAFTITDKIVEDELRSRVLRADIVQFHFSTPPQPTKAVPSNGFNWAAAGIAKPQAGWSCEVCMIPNKTEAKQCAACETERPGTSEKDAPKETSQVDSRAPASNSGSGFNWAAAGMKVPDQQWSCSVCMTSNPTSANACLACEAER
ncbi:Predicted protein [Taphrina deformans PYCC 5710]|uniref:Nuclear pore complex protein Nup153 n=1 Tax=Taphrina deformans (strain PYCC 5710 / ATCC 11124 / CBS 356.35 / IMI 108563 / JCM 9778 / NBRC 8474) TaxID=1097556 RepID=R4X885_TAPDE|nr:Predicted protein [Taphrina deformans PYCC 5710]|eukprot:CCG81728.1 Predicted protein [Taphrina deformans PYCC 5710]